MDNNHTSNNPHIIQNNDDLPIASIQIADITPLEPASIMDSNHQPPMSLDAQQELVDTLMTVEENDDMSSIYEASFTDSDVENIAPVPNLVSEGTIPQQTQNNVLSASSSQSAFSIPTPLPSSSNSMMQPQRSNRRARVEDDDDEDRDRRHPSQRVNDQPSESNNPSIPFPPPFFASFPAAGPALGLGTGFFNRMPTSSSSDNSSAPSAPNVPSSDSTIPGIPGFTPQSQPQGATQNADDEAERRSPVHIVDYEFSIVMDGSNRTQPTQTAQQQQTSASDGPNVQGGNTPTGTPPGPTGPGAAGVPPNISFNPPIPLGNLATLLGIPFAFPAGFGFPQLTEEKEDPERARKLVDGLEEVSLGLVRRLERVGTGGGGMGEDETKGGDVGCAICWDRLLFEDVEREEPTEKQSIMEGMTVDGEDTKEEKSKPQRPKIVTLPCAHVFHAECLIPWFSRPRRTTCPTCRFNIDPENLTYVSARQRRREQRRAANDNNGTDDTNQSDAPGGQANPADVPPVAGATTHLGEPQPQHDGPAVDFGGGMAGMFQLFRQGQGQPVPQQQTPAPNTGAAPSETPLRAQELPSFINGNLFPAGFAGQMAMPLPFVTVPFPPGTTGGTPVPMAIPWRMPGTTHGGNPTNVDNTDTSGGTPEATPAPATTVNESPSSNISANAPQAQPPRTIVADVLRISVDMVFDGRTRRRVNLGPIHLAPPQPADETPIPSQESQDSAPEQTMNDDTNDDDLDDLPPLMSLEEAEEQDRRFVELLDRIDSNRQNLASDTAPPNENPERIVSSNQPAEPDAQPVHEQFTQPRNIHVAGAGRSIEEAFNQAFSRLRQMAQPQPGDGGPPAADGAAPPTSQQAEPQGQGGQGQPPWQFLQFMDFAIPMRPPQPEGPKRAWAPPAPPGPTLRQRIERRELEAGLRCHDVSCGIGPSDEYPLGEDTDDTLHKAQQLSIVDILDENERKPVCEHMFHGGCLVTSERVALRGAEAVTNAGGVEVSCPVCRATGCVSKEQWDAGVLSLQ